MNSYAVIVRMKAWQLNSWNRYYLRPSTTFLTLCLSQIEFLTNLIVNDRNKTRINITFKVLFGRNQNLTFTHVKGVGYHWLALNFIALPKSQTNFLFSLLCRNNNCYLLASLGFCYIKRCRTFSIHFNRKNINIMLIIGMIKMKSMLWRKKYIIE